MYLYGSYALKLNGPVVEILKAPINPWIHILMTDPMWKVIFYEYINFVSHKRYSILFFKSYRLFFSDV